MRTLLIVYVFDCCFPPLYGLAILRIRESIFESRRQRRRQVLAWTTQCKVPQVHPGYSRSVQRAPGQVTRGQVTPDEPQAISPQSRSPGPSVPSHQVRSRMESGHSLSKHSNSIRTILYHTRHLSSNLTVPRMSSTQQTSNIHHHGLDHMERDNETIHEYNTELCLVISQTPIFEHIASIFH